MNDSWLEKKIYDISVNHFHKWYGFFCSIILLWIVALSIYKLIPQEKIIFSSYALGVLTISFLVLIYWGVYVWHYLGCSKNRLGVVVAIHVEELEDYNFFKKD